MAADRDNMDFLGALSRIYVVAYLTFHRSLHMCSISAMLITA